MYTKTTISGVIALALCVGALTISGCGNPESTMQDGGMMEGDGMMQDGGTMEGEGMMQDGEMADGEKM